MAEATQLFSEALQAEVRQQGPEGTPVEQLAESDIVDLTEDDLVNEIILLCGHINAATYRLICLIQELDRRGPWGVWDCTPAEWLNIYCGISAGAAREKVRTALALKSLPLITEAFRSGEISYSKVRALTRVATPEREDVLLETALSCTASQVERIVRGCRRIEHLDDAELNRESRHLDCYWDEAGNLVLRGRLPAEQGAILKVALDHARDFLCDADASVEDRDPYDVRMADALALMAEQWVDAGDTPNTADRYQIHVHVDVDTLIDDAGEPNDIARNQDSNVEGGSVIAPETVKRLACDGTFVRHLERQGQTLDIGRKTRVVPASMRRALRHRDGGCRFPGCSHSRYVDAHHIVAWATGGETKLDNLVLLCRRHHTFVHEGGYRIERRRVGERHEIVFSNRYGIEVPTNTRSRGNVVDLMKWNAERGLDITSQTAIEHLDGGPVDYDLFYFVLYQDDPPFDPG